MAPTESPCCVRGFITLDGKCSNCGAAIASGSTDSWPRQSTARSPRRRQDQDNVRPMTDYLRTKEDK